MTSSNIQDSVALVTQSLTIMPRCPVPPHHFFLLPFPRKLPSDFSSTTYSRTGPIVSVARC